MTDEQHPSAADEITEQALAVASKHVRRESRWSAAERIVKVGGILVLLGLVGWLLFRNISLSHEFEDTRKHQAQIQTVLKEVRAAERQTQCDRVASYKVFGPILHRIADNFSTPPYPAPDRVDAVNGLNALADFFDHAAPTPCPAHSPSTTTTAPSATP